jgi:7,8-dihydroneopterin aldolase/epimerase/oxygenase
LLQKFSRLSKSKHGHNTGAGFPPSLKRHGFHPEKKMNGFIGFNQLRVSCIIGIHPAERTTEQDLYIDLKVRTDFSQLILSDSIHDTIDYVRLAEICKDLGQSQKYYLIETFAARVLDAIFREFDVVEAAITIKKPSALPEAACAIVELSRVRKEVL